ncbi:MAG: NAD(P)/FAD-dependent oxidoreductase [Flavobacteriales bacterium]|nr:NAD(P)/FAD-dependent oxidoreductase [Flavobacteriales bacterium]
MSNHHQVLIVGGGTAGIMVAAQLKLKRSNLDIAIIEPSDKHVYQPAWTLVGAGTFDYDKTIRPESSVIPAGVTWIKEYAQTFDPENNSVTTTGATYSYDYLVVCPGIQIDLDGIPGLKDALGKGGVCSNYTDPNYTWEVIKNFKGGNAVFTQPTTPIKCGGAPQKIMYLADDYFRKSGVRNKSKVIFATPGSVIFGVPEFASTLNKVLHRKEINTKYFYAISKIDPERKEVHFRNAKPGDNQCILTEDQGIGERTEGDTAYVIPYDMLHLAPPQSAPDFVKNSRLAHQEGPSKGWMDVDKFTLQHNTYGNVFGLGDVAALPTAKTGAAIRKQAPVVVENLLTLMDTKAVGKGQYSGYSSCPLVTGYGKMVLAEFKYDNVRDSDPFLSKFVDTTKENWSMWILKKYGLPYLYWNKMMKGKM